MLAATSITYGVLLACVLIALAYATSAIYHYQCWKQLRKRDITTVYSLYELRYHQRNFRASGLVLLTAIIVGLLSATVLVSGSHQPWMGTFP